MNFLNKKIFNIISDQAHELGVRAYVIGGYVRDSLLKRESKDIDIVVEGSGIEFIFHIFRHDMINQCFFNNKFEFSPNHCQSR